MMAIPNIGIDLSKLPPLFNDKRFHDVILKLEDGERKIKVYAHRIVLILSHSSYFDALLTGGLKEQYASKIPLNVQNADVAHDIIASFYGVTARSGNLPDWEYVLEYIQLCDFWRLSWNQSLMTNLHMSPEGFEQFVDKIFSIVGLDDAIVQVINKNLPKDYPITKLPKCIVNQLIKLLPYDIVYATSKGIEMWNSGDESITQISNIKPINQVIPFGHNIICVSFLSVTIIDPAGRIVSRCEVDGQIINDVYVMNNQYLIICKDSGIQIWDTCGDKNFIPKVYSNSSIDYDMKHIPVNIISRSPNGNQVACVFGLDMIYVFDVADIHEWYFVAELNTQSKITCLSYSPCGKMIVYGDRYCSVKIWRIESGEFESIVFDRDIWNLYEGESGDILYSPNNLQMAYSNGQIIRVCNTDSGKLAHRLSPIIEKTKILFIDSIKYTPDSRYIICSVSNNDVVKSDVVTGNSTVIIDGNKISEITSSIELAHIANYETYLAYKKYIDE